MPDHKPLDGQLFASVDLLESECEHMRIQIHGDWQCFEILECSITQAQEYAAVFGVRAILLDKGFDLNCDISREEDMFTGATVFRQMKRVACKSAK